jgi:hypothetical protein
MRRRRGQEGAGKAGAIIAALVVLIVVFAAVKMIPVKIRTSEFQDFMIDEAQAAGDKKAEAVKAVVLRKAQELEIPIDKKTLDVKIERDRVKMSCRYTIPVDLILFTYQWKFSHEVDRPIFLM